MPARIHDLLEIDVERFLQAQPSAPEWVAENLRRVPFVVVRRGPMTEREIPIGVRGAQRNERWAGTCHPDLVGSIVTPRDLLRRMAAGSSGGASSTPSSRGPASHDTASRHAASSPPVSHDTALRASTLRPDSHRVAIVPALHSLSLLAQRWKALDFPWGPGGSVGFELATGRPVVRPDSDLDIVIYAESPITQGEARHLRDNARGLLAPVDIRVETPFCGFSLTEYTSRAPAPIMLRVPSGTVLGTDPWAA
jgi:phosphoribosyl-dephospho-CoA transferase